MTEKKPQTVVLTACSLNYISQATNLGESLRQTNPDCRFVIGLVDRPNPGETIESEFEILWIDQTDFNATEAAQRYNIVELVTAAKPFMLRHLFSQMADGAMLIYLDPDIMVFDRLDRISNAMEGKEIGLTPHFLAPIEDKKTPTEQHIARTGVFNLGFLSLKKGPQSLRLLDWWAKRLQSSCYIDFKRGLFVDQAWMNLVPAYFESHKILRDPGMNAAHWNLHERMVHLGSDGLWSINGFPLTFYHFSHYSPKHPDRIASFHNRINLSDNIDLSHLYQIYHDGLIRNNYFEHISRPCAFSCKPLGINRYKVTAQYINDILPSRLRNLGVSIYKRLSRDAQI